MRLPPTSCVCHHFLVSNFHVELYTHDSVHLVEILGHSQPRLTNILKPHTISNKSQNMFCLHNAERLAKIEKKTRNLKESKADWKKNWERLHILLVWYNGRPGQHFGPKKSFAKSNKNFSLVNFFFLVVSVSISAFFVANRFL